MDKQELKQLIREELSRNLNEVKQQKLAYDLSMDFNKSNPIEDYIIFIDQNPGGKWTTRGDGKRMKNMGTIKPYNRMMDNKKEIPYSVTSEIVDNFWKYLTSIPGVKKYSPISNWDGPSSKDETVKYQNVLFIKRKYAIEYGSPSRATNPNSVWRT